LYAVAANLDEDSEKNKNIQNVIFAFSKNSGFAVKVQRYFSSDIHILALFSFIISPAN